MKEIGLNKKGLMLSDASAALGIIERRGLGKLRHIDTSYLWLQEVNATRFIRYGKVPGKDNPADLGTKNLSNEDVQRHLHKLRMRLADGRAISSAELKSICLNDAQTRRKAPSHKSRTQVRSMLARDDANVATARMKLSG